MFPKTLLCTLLILSLGLPSEAASKKKTTATKTEYLATQTPSRGSSKTSSSKSKTTKKSTPQAVQTEPNGAPKTRAAAVLVFDAISGQVLHEKNADSQRPPASTQKLLTALIIAETGDLDRPVTIRESDTWAEPVKLGFKVGDVYTRRQLLEILLVHSMNDVACALARDNAGSVAAFATKMNARAEQLGARNSNFVNPNGLPAKGQFSNARDMARIARAAYANRTIRSIVSIKMLDFRYANGQVRTFKNTNRVLREVPWCNGMKTGYTAAAGRCLIASGSLNGREVISVVLGDTSESIWKDSYSLLAWGLTKP